MIHGTAARIRIDSSRNADRDEKGWRSAKHFLNLAYQVLTMTIIIKEKDAHKHNSKISMEIKDLAGLSQPLTRLIEVIAQGVGTVGKPFLTRLTTNTEVDKIHKITAALDEMEAKHLRPISYQNGDFSILPRSNEYILNLESQSLEERTQLRLNYQEQKKQNNIERITSIAAQNLLQEETVPEEKPDEEVINRFFNIAQDISSEEMQALWGQILSGEIKKPGSFSLRTLEVIRNLSKDEAELIALLGKMAISINNVAFVDVRDKAWLQHERGIPQINHFILGELGILYPMDLSISLFQERSQDQLPFVHHDHFLLIEREEIKRELKLPVWKFTAIGMEILSLVQGNPDDEYLERLGQFFVENGGKAFLYKITNTQQNNEKNQMLNGNLIKEITSK